MRWILGALLAIGLGQSIQAGQEVVLGNPRAPITIISYTSLTCSHCAQFQSSILPYLKTNYLDTGKAQLIVRDYPLDNVALKATMVARSFPLQYEELASKLYGSQEEWVNAKDLEEALAKVTGLPLDVIRGAIGNQALMNEIIASNLEAQNRYKIPGTPTFLVGGQIIPKALTPQEFDQLLGAQKPSVISINNG